MRIKDDITYKEYKDSVSDAFHLLGRKGYETANKITDYMVDEENESGCDSFVGTSMALWVISVGEYEIRHDILEKRVHDELCYHIPAYERGEYTDITPEEKEELEKDIAYIKSKIEMYEVHKVEDDEE